MRRNKRRKRRRKGAEKAEGKEEERQEGEKKKRKGHFLSLTDLCPQGQPTAKGLLPNLVTCPVVCAVPTAGRRLWRCAHVSFL